MLSRARLRWLLEALLAAAAVLLVRLAVDAGTPIDRDLPLVAVVVVACARVVRETRWAAAIECAIPSLVVAMLLLADERTRLMAYGVIVAAAFALAAAFAAGAFADYAVLTVAGVTLLRWLPVSTVEIWRELVVLAGVMALLAAMRPRNPLALIAVLAVAAVTPTHPGKAALFPLALAVVVAATRRDGLKLVPHQASGKSPMWDGLQPVLSAALLLAASFVRWSLVPLCVAAAFALLVPYLAMLRPLAYGLAVALFALWPWSGMVARALPVVMRFEPPAGQARWVGWALGAEASNTFEVPPHVRRAIVNASAANAAGMPRGRLLGTIETMSRDGWRCTRRVRIGDVADFGFDRREHFFAARNPLPRISRADVRGYGATAWLYGAGAVGVACRGDIVALQFRGADDLPPGVRFQVESIELPSR